MRVTLIILFNVLVFGKAIGQEIRMEKINWTEARDTLKGKLKPGYYLCVEVPKDYEGHGFKEIRNKHYYFLSKKDFLPIHHIDTVFQRYDKGFKMQVLSIKLSKVDAKPFLDFTIKLKGLKIGLLSKNKFIYVATISSPISDGNIEVGGDYTEKEINDIEDAIKSFKQ